MAETFQLEDLLSDSPDPGASYPSDPIPSTDRNASRAYARKEAEKRGLDPDLVDRIFTRESGYNPQAKSPKGAAGIAQLMPDTARRFGVKNPYDPKQSIDGGLDYLQFLHNQFKGDHRLIAAGYHAGEGDAQAALANPKGNPKTTAYTNAVAGGAFRLEDLLDGGPQKPAPASQVLGSAQPFRLEDLLTDTPTATAVTAPVAPVQSQAPLPTVAQPPIGALPDSTATTEQPQSTTNLDPANLPEGVSIENQQVPKSETDLYRDWYNARAKGDFAGMSASGQSYLQQFPKGKYAPHIQQGAKQFTADGDIQGQQKGAGAYVPVKDIEAMRAAGKNDSDILNAIQDSAARQIGLEPSDVAALTEKYGQHPLVNIVEPGSDARSSVDSIIKQGKSNGGLAEFNIRPEAIQTFLSDQKAYKPENVDLAQKIHDTHSVGLKDMLSGFAADSTVVKAFPELGAAAQYLADSPNAMKLMAALSSGGLEHAGDVAQTAGNVSEHPLETLHGLLSDFISGGHGKKSKFADYGETFADYAQNIDQQRGGKYGGIRTATKTVLDLIPVLLAAEVGGGFGAAVGAPTGGTTTALAAYGAAEKLHEGPKAALINATLLAGPYAMVAKLGLGPTVEKWISNKLAPTSEMAEAALSAGTKQEAIDAAAGLLSKKLTGKVLGTAIGETANGVQFIATAAAIQGALEGKQMSTDEIVKQALLFGGFAALGIIKGGAEARGEVAAKKSAVEQAAFGESTPTEGTVVEPKQVGPGSKLLGPREEPPTIEPGAGGKPPEPPALKGTPHEVRPPIDIKATEVAPERPSAAQPPPAEGFKTSNDLLAYTNELPQRNWREWNQAQRSDPAVRKAGAAYVATEQGTPAETKAREALDAAELKFSNDYFAKKETTPNATQGQWAYHKTTTEALAGIRAEGMDQGDFTTGSAIDFPGDTTIRVRMTDIPGPPQTSKYGAADWVLPHYEQNGPQGARTAIPANKIEVKVGRKWVALPEYSAEKGETSNVTQKGKQQAGDQTKLRGTGPGENLPTHEGEIRQSPGGQAAGSDSTQASGEEQGQVERKFSSTQVNLPESEATRRIERFGKMIPDSVLAADGRETTPHITVKYGLHGDDIAGVKKVLADEGPITVTLGKTSIFSASESGAADVVKVDIDSPDLHRLNAKIADALPHTDTFPDYKPHLTVAYVKPGEGKKYAGKSFVEGQKITLNSIAFSDTSGNVTEIPLKGEATSETGQAANAARETSKEDVLTGKGAVSTAPSKAEQFKAALLNRKAEKETASPPTSEKYYIRLSDSEAKKAKTDFQEVEAKPVKSPKGFEFLELFSHRTPEKFGGQQLWAVSEAHGGQRIATGPNLKQAISNANSSLSNQSEAVVRRALDKRIAEAGSSPRYAVPPQAEPTSTQPSVRDIPAIAQSHGGIHPESVKKFYAAFDGLRTAVETKQNATVIKKLRELQDVLHLDNKQLRKLFAEETGITLPKTVRDTSTALVNWMRSGAPIAERAPEPKVSEAEIKARTSQAGELGKIAFEAGKKRVPAQDAGVMPLLKGLQAGQSLPILDAWLKAWDKANLAPAAPVGEYLPEIVRLEEERANAQEVSGNEQPTETQPVGAVGTRPLETASSQDVSGTTAERPVAPGARRGEPSGAADLRQSDQQGIESRLREGDRVAGTDLLASGERSGAGVPTGLPGRKGKSDKRVRELADGTHAKSQQPSAANTAPNFRIESPEFLTAGGKKTKFKQNIQALQTLRTVLSEARAATREEQELLARFSGWGQFPEVFNYHYKGDEWYTEQQQLRELLGDDYEAARKSTLNAHYTAPEIVQGMWVMARKLGFEKGRILEPSMGIGNFFGLIPEDLAQSSLLTGMELDKATGAMAQLLYPQANIQVRGFETLKVPDGFFDLAISNVPFGDYKVFDKEYNRFGATIHNYFFLKALDKVRPGGAVMFITSTFTMDSQDSRIRKLFEKRADLVAAMRFPAETFHKSAGTSVVTDLVILKKRAEGEAPSGPSWMTLGTVDDPGGGKPIGINQYFIDNPDQVLGVVDRKGTMYGAQAANVSRTPDFAERFQKAIDALPANVITTSPVAAPKPVVIGADEGKLGVKDGGRIVRKGKVFRRQGDTLVAEKLAAEDAKKLDAMLGIRDAVKESIKLQMAGAAEAQIKKARTVLNEGYDTFVRKNGPLNKRSNKALIIDDPDGPVLLALETPVGKEWKKADIFHKDTVRAFRSPDKAESINEAVGVSLFENGRIDVPRIAKLLGQSPAQTEKRLVTSGLAFRDPREGWTPRDLYLSGNVRRKLTEAKEAAAADTSYQANVGELEKVQPEDIDYTEIEARLGVPWVPPEDVADFMSGLMNTTPDAFRVNFLPHQGTWIVEYSRRGEMLRNSQIATKVWGTERAPFIKIMDAALTGVRIMVYDKTGDTNVLNPEATEAANAKVNEVQEQFRDWLWKDDARRKRLHRYYNDNYNNIRPIEYDAAHYRNADGVYVLPGQNPEIQLRPHQANAVWQIVSTGKALLAHEVGTGKTFTKVTAAMELRRLGLARKPAIAVPKSIINQYVNEAKALYPSARILSTDGMFDAQNRKQTISRIATGDYDMVIMTHDNMDMLPMTPEVTRGYIQREAAELEEAIRASKESDGERNNRVVKQLEKAKAKLEARLREAIEGSRKDNAVFFEETGIDFLMVDEAHKYKSLPVYSAQRMKGIPTTRSDRATNMMMRSRWLQDENKGRGVVFATGTPISNTLVELFNLQRYLQFQDLLDREISHFDSWLATFAAPVTRVERTVTGEYGVVTRLSSFVNLPELTAMTQQFMDVQRADDMSEFVQRPARADSAVVVKATPELKDYMSALVDRANAVKKRMVEPDIDNMLKISTDGRKSALDMRLVDPSATDDPDSKANALVKNVLKYHAAHPDKTQMIFSDIGVSETPWGFKLYEDIVRKLVRGGIPRDKILDYSRLTDAQRRLASQRLKRGDALVALGSSEKLGTGVNAQDKLLVLHHLDVPWLPAYIEQRDGRGWRQGNENPTVFIHRYITEDSFDAFMWQLVENKARFINQVMNKKNTERVVRENDTEELSYAELTAIASGNPLILKKNQLEDDVERMERARRRHDSAQTRSRDAASYLEDDSIPAQERRLEKYRTDQKQAQATEGLDFEITLKGQSFDERKAAAEKLLTLVIQRQDMAYSEREAIGSYRGFTLEVRRGKTLEIVGQAHYDVSVNEDSPVGMLASADATLRNLGGRIINQEEVLAQKRKELVALKEQLGKPFKEREELAKKQAALKEISAELAKPKVTPEEEAAHKVKTETESRAGAPLAASIPQQGGAPTTLTDWFRNRRNAITGQFSGLPSTYDALTGGARQNVRNAWDRFKDLFIRNLSKLERTSPEAHKFALRAGGSRGQATVLLSLAANKIDKELKGSGITWPMVRAALVESRLRGIRERYLDFAQQSLDATDEDLADALGSGLMDVLKHIEGRAGLDDTLAQRAAAMLEAEDFDSLRDFLGATFEIAADNVGRVNMGPDPNAFEKLTAHPAFQKALDLYKNLIEEPIAESHSINEGVFSDALGPLDTYYPLVAVKEEGGILHRLFSGTKYPYRKPKNIANYFATGLAEHGYSLEMTDFADRIRAAIRINNKAALLSELDQQGLIKVLGRYENPGGAGGSYQMMIDGEIVPAQLVDTGNDLLVVRDGETHRVPGARALIPNWIEKELRPILSKERIEAGMGAGLINKIIQASLIGPMDLTWHSFNIIGTLVANTPFINSSFAGMTIGNLPFTKLAAGLIEIARTDPSTEESISDMTEMANLGLIPPRFGSATYSRRYAELTGAKLERLSGGPMLYGPMGLDVRARLVLWRAAKVMNPDATPTQLFKFVTQLGVYNRELESEIERWAKASRIAPFATAGATMLRNGINAWTGTGPKPVDGVTKKSAYWLAQMLSGGAAGLIALWALTYKAYKKEWPWEDPEARLLQIPLNADHRNSKLGQILYGPDPTKTAYVNFAFFSPLVSRGSRALGIAGAFDTRRLGGTLGQQGEYAQRDIYNSFIHPFTSGPLVRAPFIFLTGNEPSLTSLRDTTGRFGPQFFPATVKAAPGLSTVGRRAEEAVLNVNPFFKTAAGAFGIGEKGEQMDRQQSNRWVRMITDVVAPRLLGSSVDVVAKKQALERQQKAATSKPTSEVKLPDDVRIEMHKVELIPSKPVRKEGESDTDYLQRSEASAEGIGARVRALMKTDVYKAMSQADKREALKGIVKDERHDTTAAPKGQTEGEKTFSLDRSMVEDRVRNTLEQRDDFKGLSKDQQLEALRQLGQVFGKFSIPAKAPADARERAAGRAKSILENFEQRGVFDKAIDQILKAVQKKAA